MSKWTRFRDRILGKVVDWLKDLVGWEEPSAKPEDIYPDPDLKPEPKPGDDAWEQAPFRDFDWCYGGFKGGEASMIPGCEIEALKADKNGLSYRWRKGGCELLGASGRGDYHHTLACLFVLKKGKWRGGKFDWISTNRTRRSFTNIYDGYAGWSSSAVEDAEAVAFVIVSADGRKRTNTIIREGAL